jgi:NitT/TauT family transport system permease protein
VTAATPARRPIGTSGIAGFVRRWGPPVIVLLGVLLVWQAIAAGPGRRVVPAPTVIAAAVGTNTDILLRSTAATFLEAIGGLIIGTVLGLIIAFATARWTTARGLLLPVAIASSAIPIIAVAPILNNWFGVLNPVSKMAMAALLVFFPVVVNVTRGLVEVQPSQIELMRAYAATETEILRKVRIPNMLPYFFTAMKVAVTLAFIGALVGEYFGGTSEVLGRVVLQSMSSGSFDLAWAAILIGALAAIVGYLVVTLIERIAIPWALVAEG